MIIPYYRREGFVIDFTCAVPIYDEELEIYNIAMYIHPRIALLFRDIWSPEGQFLFDVGYYIQSNEDFDCADFHKRVEEFKPFQKARIKRRFEDKRSSIFFDEDEVEILAAMFKQEKFTAIVEVYIDGKITPIEEVSPSMYKIIRPFLKAYKVVEIISPDKYRRYKKIKKVKVKKPSNRTGVKQVDKIKDISRIIAGAAVTGLSIIGVVFGIKIINEGIDGVKGEIVEAEIVRR